MLECGPSRKATYFFKRKKEASSFDSSISPSVPLTYRVTFEKFPIHKLGKIQYLLGAVVKTE